MLLVNTILETMLVVALFLLPGILIGYQICKIHEHHAKAARQRVQAEMQVQREKQLIKQAKEFELIQY